MDEITAQIRRVQGLLKRGEVSCRRFAILAGLPPTTLENIHSENWNPKAETLAALVRAANQIERKGRPKPPTRLGCNAV